MTYPDHKPPGLPGCFPALLAINAGVVAAWQWMFGDPMVAIWACWAFLMAGLYSAACRTIAAQRAELAVLRTATRSSP